VLATNSSVLALDLQLIEFVNSLSKAACHWRADTNSFFAGKDLEYARSLMGTKGFDLDKVVSSDNPTTFLAKPHATRKQLSIKRYGSEDTDVSDIPESFDSREQWGAICPSLHDVRDQADCGSCWAVGFAAAASDRACIASNGAFTQRLSDSDPLSCCADCGDGCDGGYIDNVWDYYRNQGVVTGGPYNDDATCFSYEFPPCEHHVNSTNSNLKSCSKEGEEKKAMKCPNQCTVTHKEWDTDKHFASEAYGLASVVDIQRDIMKHGPVEAAFRVTSDFPAYRSGVYHSVSTKVLGGHAIKVVGWGVEDGIPYWQCVNSWRREWGDQGTFRIKRGVNECGIEEQVFGGVSINKA